MDYTEFLKNKSSIHYSHGHQYIDSMSDLFHYQKPCVEWATQKGRSALFQDTGLGKTIQQLAWADSVCKETDGKVLILAPLSVTNQTVEEGLKFGLTVNKCRSNAEIKKGINITNYDILSHFDCSKLDGVVLDESGILKNFTGKIRNEIISNFRNTPYKLACSATPAPNDMMEIGNHAEFLGVMSRTEMLATYFVHDGGETAKWRLKGHAPKAFWKWMSTWALMMKKPSDIGFSNVGFELPELKETNHFVEYGDAKNGEMFKSMASGLNEQRAVRKGSINERMEKAHDIIDGEQWLIWCDINPEQDALEKAFKGKCLSIRGSMSDDKKIEMERRWRKGEVQILITKPSIYAFGVNWQHCHNTMFFGLSNSYEKKYQAVRRFWRFGQKHTVNVHVIVTDVERPIIENIQRKHDQAENMSIEMIKQMADFTKDEISKTTRKISEYKATSQFKMPSWVIGV